MEPWQTILAAVVTTLSAIGMGVWKFLRWMLDEIRKRDQAFLAALKELHKDHRSQEDSLQAKADEQRERRLEDQRKHIETMHALAEKLTSKASSPPSR